MTLFFFTYSRSHSALFFFFFNDTATTEIYTLSLHDALPIWTGQQRSRGSDRAGAQTRRARRHHRHHRAHHAGEDRKSTRLNSSHGYISYAVFCLKKKKKNQTQQRTELPTHDKTQRVGPKPPH